MYKHLVKLQTAYTMYELETLAHQLHLFYLYSRKNREAISSNFFQNCFYSIRESRFTRAVEAILEEP